MKKILLLLAFLVVVALLISCDVQPPDPSPEIPQDVVPWCQEYYDLILAKYPDFPQAFMGVCVSASHSENPMSVISLCGSETFWQYMEGWGAPVFNSKHECIQYLKSLKE